MNQAATQEFIRVLTIAGSDSGGGAGIQADLKTFAALGCFGMSAITVLTAQNTQGVTGIHGAPPEFLRAQIDAVMEDMGAQAVKIGMLHAPEIVRVVAYAVAHHHMRNVVLDPVMVSATGAVLIEPDAQRALVDELFPRVALITPNLDEAALLLGRPLRSVDVLEAAAVDLLQLGARAALLKGAHLPGPEVVDVLAIAGEAPRVFSDARIRTNNLHGAGCTLSSAIAAHLALGQPLLQAVQSGRGYVRSALSASASVRTGHGVGPLNHGFAPLAQRTVSHN